MEILDEEVNAHLPYYSTLKSCGIFSSILIFGRKYSTTFLCAVVRQMGIDLFIYTQLYFKSDQDKLFSPQTLLTKEYCNFTNFRCSLNFGKFGGQQFYRI